MDFYVDLGGTKAGPYSVESLKEKGYWKPERLVRKEGATEWVRVADLKEEDLKEIPKKVVEKRPEPPEKLSREASIAMVLIFPLYILATLYEEKAEYHYRQGNYRLADEYTEKVHTCLALSIALFFILIIGCIFYLKTHG